MSPSTPLAYVGLCRFEQLEDENGLALQVEPGQTLPTFEAPVVVRAGSVLEYDQIATQLLPDFGYRLLRTENVMPINTWFETHGFNEALGELAKKVLKGPRLEIGTMRSVGFEQTHGVAGTANTEQEQDPLIITEHAYTQLPDQTGTAFWDQEWISDDLKQLLFGQDLPEEHQHILGESREEEGEGEEGAAPLIRTYFIVDATLRRKITKFFDLNMTFEKLGTGADWIEGANGNRGNIEYRSLFKGATQEELKEVAPYLFDMTLPERAYEDKDYVPGFHKNFFKSTWDPITLERSEGLTHLDTGIFIRTPADFETVWRHFRKFTRIQDENGKWYYWRFWERGMFDLGKNLHNMKLESLWIPKLVGDQNLVFIVKNHLADCYSSSFFLSEYKENLFKWFSLYNIARERPNLIPEISEIGRNSIFFKIVNIIKSNELILDDTIKEMIAKSNNVRFTKKLKVMSDQIGKSNKATQKSIILNMMGRK